MSIPTIFDRENAPNAAHWLLTASFYETRNKPAQDETDGDRTAQAGMISGFHADLINLQSGDNHAE